MVHDTASSHTTNTLQNIQFVSVYKKKLNKCLKSGLGLDYIYSYSILFQNTANGVFISGIIYLGINNDLYLLVFG